MPPPPSRPTRPPRPSPPALPAFDALDPTHLKIMQLLGALECLVQAMDDGGDDDAIRATARDACRFFGHAARLHHDIEESAVFPRLLADASPEMLGHIRRLQQDHAWLEEDWLELEPHLQAVAQGWRSEHHDFLRRALPEFTTLYQQHIALEEAVIYPEARRRRAGAPNPA